MRSSSFIILSLAIHILCVAAVALSPQKISESEGHDIEVAVGEPAEQPGVQEAALPEPTPAVKVAPVKKTVAVKKPATAPKPEPTETAELPAKETPAPTPEPEQELTPEIENVSAMAKEEASDEKPVGIEADKTSEATSPEASAPAPAPVAAEATSSEAKDGGPLGKGGATQEGAVSYTSLRQTKGNKPPTYPLKARKEKRMGQIDLVYRVKKDGTVTDVQIAKSSGHSDLDQSAVRAVSKFRFIPGQDGWAYHPVSFALIGDEAPLPSRLRTAGSEGAE